jgi:hypothetical protein
MKNLTNRELLDLIHQSLKQTAEDVREGRVPLDGRVRFPPRDTSDDQTGETVQQAVPKN